ncbi:MAG: RAD55 family ATPase [Halobacteriaceae archaeon]
MSQEAQPAYEFVAGLPIEEMAPGTTLFVSGDSMSQATEVGLSMTLTGSVRGEGSILISTNTPANRLIDDGRAVVPALDPSRVAVVDCTGQGEKDTAPSDIHVETVSTPADLTGIGIKFSTMVERLRANDIDRVRMGLFNVSTMLMYSDLRKVFTFLHTISGRISATGGLGVFVIDPSSHDEESVSMLNQLCDGRIEVQETETPDDDGEIRVRGIRQQPNAWTPFSLSGGEER